MVAPSSEEKEASAPAQSWLAAIEFEVPGAYSQSEERSAAIMSALATKGKLISSALRVGDDQPSRLLITLVTQETAFLE
jgi:hypothetical protein